VRGHPKLNPAVSQVFQLIGPAKTQVENRRKHLLVVEFCARRQTRYSSGFPQTRPRPGPSKMKSPQLGLVCLR
jgi:hypothetical protein